MKFFFMSKQSNVPHYFNLSGLLNNNGFFDILGLAGYAQLWLFAERWLFYLQDKPNATSFIFYEKVLISIFKTNRRRLPLIIECFEKFIGIEFTETALIENNPMDSLGVRYLVTWKNFHQSLSGKPFTDA